MNDNSTVQSLWIGDELSLLECLCLSSFVKNGHIVHLYTYREVKRVPSKVVVKDAADIIPEREIFCHTARARFGRGSYAGFSNLFRYELLRTKGGWWVDTDVVCLKPFDFADEYCIERQNNFIINNAVIKAPRGSEFTHTLVDVARNPHCGRPWDSIVKRLYCNTMQRFRRRFHGDLRWGQTGPWALTKVVEHLALNAYIKPSAVFYPIRYKDWRTIYTSSADTLYKIKDSYALHLWNEFSRRKNIDKNASFPPDSIIERLKSRYL